MSATMKTQKLIRQTISYTDINGNEIRREAQLVERKPHRFKHLSASSFYASTSVNYSESEQHYSFEGYNDNIG